MANCSQNPNYANHKTSGADTSISESLVGGGASALNGAAIVVTANSHPVATRADGALWDITAGAYVAIQNTNIGTTSVPKNGQ